MFNFMNDSISSGLSSVSGFDQNQSSLPHWYVAVGSGFGIVYTIEGFGGVDPPVDGGACAMPAGACGGWYCIGRAKLPPP